ncbi:hypothetical protein FEM48_Zijuj01G0226700 [Ziziphus jujuba var. spinosa]|uniref:Nucleolus and neural progenitor protein-like N-terminal domain-containing protein n=1 Tax=Ziziphus jujuba var. spinosa TaxID=714518 RepID=A0A978W3Z1_ZIZJJ|nr:hypothetical protein FEM48_Zijuj01G0226700 [Ziziphus jujuba var. spinosa]
MPMDSEVDTLEEKLTSLLGQLQIECGIFERMVYKNKNQHRRCSYFQYLLKVRRDLRLLQSAKLEDILNSCFEVITGRRPRQKVHLLESLKRRKCEGEKYNFMDRLLGAARLLSQVLRCLVICRYKQNDNKKLLKVMVRLQLSTKLYGVLVCQKSILDGVMVEPMLKASIEISILLARSFFMGFSQTILALLARIRVLVQQILLDVVSVFNMVSSLSRKKQSVKITQDGLEVFREIFPTKEEFATLECVWKSDKFILLERKHKSDISSHDEDPEGNASIPALSLKYQSLDSFLGDEPHSKRMDEDHAAKKDLTHTQEGNTDLSPGVSIGDDDGKVVEGCSKVGDASSIEEIPSKEFPQGGLLPGTSSFPSSNASSKLQSGSRRVAFVSVKNPQPSACSVSGIHLKQTESKSDSKEDAFFSLLSAGNTKDSLF